MSTYAEVAEHVRAVIAAHAQAQDDGRAEDVAALYTSDGVLVIPGYGTFEGSAAVRALWEQAVPRAPQRHITTNVLLTSWNDEEARSSTDVVFVQKGEAGWAVQIVARYHDTFRNVDGTWLLARRDEEFVGYEIPAAT